MPAGVIVSVSEKESPREGVRAWEIVWTVTGFLQIVRSDEAWIRDSPDFKWTGKEGRETESWLCVGGCPVDGVKWLLVRHGSLYTKTKASVCLLGRDEAEHHSVSEDDFWEGGRDLILLPYSMFVEQQDNLTSPDGSLTIIFRFQAVVGELGPRTPAVYGEPSLLGNHLLQLYRSGDMSDAKIFVSEQVFPGHRLILAARSPVLAAMLRSDMIEGNTGEIRILDSAPGPVDTFLQYLYTGTISFTDNIPEILHLADKYQVRDLKTLCVKALADTLTVSNAVDYVQLAALYSLTDLRKRIVSLFKEHREILHSEQWKALIAYNPALTSEILMELVGNS